jgi:Sugar kinases, ribokinase family
MKILVFGETIWDVYPDKSTLGGASLNFCANLALLGDDACFITGLGRDELGTRAASMLREYGVRDDFFQLSDRPTGQCIVTLGEEGIPSYRVLTDVAYDDIRTDEKTLAAIGGAGFDVFYFNTLSQRSPTSRASVRAILEKVSFPEIFCDVNIREGCWDRDSLALCMEYATIAKVSEEEAHFFSDCGLTDAALPFDQAVHEAFPNVHLLVYTLGADGSAVYDYRDGTAYSSGKPDRVSVVSTVGAGDCYGASFLHHYMQYGDIAAAIRFAAARCCVVVSNAEAIPQAFVDEAKKK